jgi:hypothetical protein
MALTTRTTDEAIRHAETLMRACLEQQRQAQVWAVPYPVFLRQPTGTPTGWQWGIRVGLGMTGWCAGRIRVMTIPLAIYGASPLNPWQPPADARQAVAALIAKFGDGAITVHEPVVPDIKVATRPHPEEQGKRSRAQSYNASPARAVRLRRAAQGQRKRRSFYN